MNLSCAPQLLVAAATAVAVVLLLLCSCGFNKTLRSVNLTKKIKKTTILLSLVSVVTIKETSTLLSTDRAVRQRVATKLVLKCFLYDCELFLLLPRSGGTEEARIMSGVVCPSSMVQTGAKTDQNSRSYARLRAAIFPREIGLQRPFELTFPDECNHE